MDDQDRYGEGPAPREPSHWALVSDDDLELALADLQPRYQRAYVLHTVDGLSYHQIAQTLQVPCSTVGTRILRARLLLRAFLMKRIEGQAAVDSD